MSLGAHDWTAGLRLRDLFTRKPQHKPRPAVTGSGSMPLVRVSSVPSCRLVGYGSTSARSSFRGVRPARGLLR